MRSLFSERQLETSRWLRVSLINLFIVSALGTIMRYKIGFEFPYLSQKNLQNAHSHFAFVGWITHTLYVLMAGVLSRDNPSARMSKYRTLIVANLVCAYCMLISFAIQGYSGISIAFSTASIVVSYIFSVCMFRDLRAERCRPYRNWFVAALWFSILSSIGTFTLGAMMGTHNFDQRVHLASLYYYLHFQYNGFFFFSCAGLLVATLFPAGAGDRRGRTIFWMFFLSCIPAYFLSVLWIPLPMWTYALVIVAAVAQLVAWVMLAGSLRKKVHSLRKVRPMAYYMLILIAVCLSVKFVLQLGSVIPEVSKLAFGFRQIIVAYLHLVLLAIISVFLISYMLITGVLEFDRGSRTAVFFFICGVYANQLFLGVLGVASFSYIPIPFANEFLFAIAALMAISLATIVIRQQSTMRWTQRVTC